MLEKLWSAIDGKKTYLSIIAWVILSLMHDSGKITQENFDMYQTIILGFGGIGLVHKAEKTLGKK